MFMEIFLTKMLEGFAHTSGAMIVLIPSFLFLARFSEHRRMQTMQKGLKEMPNLFSHLLNINKNTVLSPSPEGVKEQAATTMWTNKFM